jgi:iron complex transport system substrate-binding protein
MGVADRLVARTDFDQHPAVRALPSVGGGLTPSIEWLAARSPDLVVAWPDAPSRSLVSRLEQVGIPVYAAPTESVADAFAVARDLGTLFAMQAAADSVINEVRLGLDSLRTAVAGTQRRSVLYLVGSDPLMAAGPGTFIDELIRAAGARNALQGLGIRWPQLSLEAVVRRAPDAMIVATSNMAGDPVSYFQGRPGWRHVPAVRNGRVYAVDPDHNRPGPRLHRSAALLATLIHDSASAPVESAPGRGSGGQ